MSTFEDFKKDLRTAGSLLKSGQPLNDVWKGYGVDGSTIEKVRSTQRSMSLTYCNIFSKYYSPRKSLEIGIEKNMFTCRALGLDFGSWTTVDKVSDVKGFKADIVCDIINTYTIDGYDFVICSSVLEHVFDIFKGFERIFELCKKGGVVYISTPFLYKLHLKPEDYWRLTPYAYDKIISQYSDKYIILEENYNGKLWGVSCFACKE